MESAQPASPTTVDTSDPALLREAVARAVDFRGDVTVTLDDGSEVTGYAFDASLASASPTIRLLPPESTERVTIPLGRIRSLSFTGKDAASGKTWGNWLRRYAAKKLAGEAASIESEAL